MAVTLRDIARSLNLSHATVSFVLNDRRDVSISESTRRRVRDAAVEMGYRPNRAARALVSGRTNLIALWMPSLRNPVLANVFDHLQSELRGNGYGTFYAELAAESTPPYLDWSLDGVIGIAFGRPPSDDHVYWAQSTNILVQGLSAERVELDWPWKLAPSGRVVVGHDSHSMRLISAEPRALARGIVSAALGRFSARTPPQDDTVAAFTEA